MATQEELEFQALLNQAMAGAGQAPSDMPVQAVDPVRAERLAFEASQAAPVASVAPPASVAPVAAPSAEQIMLAQQDAIRQNALAQRTQAAETAKTIAQRPRQRFLREGEGFMDAFKNPGAGQRQFAINAGLSLLSSGGTQDLSQRIGHALGAGVQGMQAARQGELDVASQAAKAKQAALAGEGQGLAQEVEFGRDLATLRSEKAKEQREIEKADLTKERFEFDKYKFENPNITESTVGKLQDRRTDLSKQLALSADPVQSENLQKQIEEINIELSADEYYDPESGALIKKQGATKFPPKTQLDLSDELAKSGSLSRRASEVIYNKSAIDADVGGREYVIPGVGELITGVKRLANPEIANYVAQRRRFNVANALGDMRILAPVTDTDSKLLIMNKGFDDEMNPIQSMREWETRMLPENAALIYQKNMEYKGSNPNQGPAKAAINRLIYAEANFEDSMNGYPMTNFSPADQAKRLQGMLEMYPTTSEAGELAGNPDAFEFNGRVVSSKFLESLSNSTGLNVEEIAEIYNVKQY